MEHVSTEIANQGLYGLAENARNRIQAPVKGLPNRRTECLATRLVSTALYI